MPERNRKTRLLPCFRRRGHRYVNSVTVHFLPTSHIRKLGCAGKKCTVTEFSSQALRRSGQTKRER